MLRAANALLDRPLPDGRLRELAAALGSDVPFFLGRAALARGTGRGERLEPLAPLSVAPVVLVLPPVHVSTAEAYDRLACAREGGGEPPCFGYVGGAPANWDEVAREAVNDFEAVVPRQWPEVAASLHALREGGAVPALLSGSGGACFGIFADPVVAAATAETLRGRLGWPALVTRTRTTMPEPTEGENHPGG